MECNRCGYMLLSAAKSCGRCEKTTMDSVRRAEWAYGGWGAGSALAMLCIVMLLVFLPLGMATGPVLPPSFPMLFAIPVVMAGLLIFLCQASKSD